MACLNLNQVILAGRITADPELRHSPTSGKMCCSFCIAYNHRKSDKTMVAEYFRVTVWDKTAETVCRYFHKGSSICVRGVLTIRIFRDHDGKEHRNVEIDADRIYFVDYPSQGGQGGQSGQGGPQPEQFTELKTDDDLPF